MPWTGYWCKFKFFFLFAKQNAKFLVCELWWISDCSGCHHVTFCSSQGLGHSVSWQVCWFVEMAKQLRLRRLMALWPDITGNTKRFRNVLDALLGTHDIFFLKHLYSKFKSVEKDLQTTSTQRGKSQTKRQHVIRKVSITSLSSNSELILVKTKLVSLYL